MAQIDASIPLQARGPQIRDPLEVYGNALNVQGMQQRNALAQRAMQQEDAARSQAMADQEVLRAYFQAGPGADNLNALRSRPHLFTAEQRRLMDMDKEAAEIGGKKATTEKTQNEVRVNQFMQIAHTMRGVKDQASYAGAMELVASLFGPDMVGKLPPQYDPATVQKMLDGALTQAQAVQNQTATRGQDMTDARTRSEGAANRAVTMRGQNLTNERARDTAAAGGKPPPGYRFKPDGNLEAIPGGPADIKAGELGAKAASKRAALTAGAENVISAVSEARGLVGITSAGAAGQLLSNLGGSNARDLKAKLDTLKGNLAFDRLQEMRDNSPTGGALGSVAVAELNLLESTVASLDQAQSVGELRKALDKIERHYKRWLNVVNQDQQQRGAAPQSGGGGANWSPADDELINKYL